MPDPNKYIVKLVDKDGATLGRITVYEYNSAQVGLLIQKRLTPNPNTVDGFILTNTGGTRVSNVYSFEVIEVETPDSD